MGDSVNYHLSQLKKKIKKLQKKNKRLKEDVKFLSKRPPYVFDQQVFDDFMKHVSRPNTGYPTPMGYTVSGYGFMGSSKVQDNVVETFSNIFNSIEETVPFDEKWGGTNESDSHQFIKGELLKLQLGQIVRTTDNLGRRCIMVGTSHGIVMAYERYTGLGLLNSIMVACPVEIWKHSEDFFKKSSVLTSKQLTDYFTKDSNIAMFLGDVPKVNAQDDEA